MFCFDIVIEISSQDVGRIIGKGGARIRIMEDETGCKIKVIRSQPGSAFTKVKLAGSSDSIEEAKAAIFEVARQKGDNRDRRTGDPAPSPNDTQSWENSSSEGCESASKYAFSDDWCDQPSSKGHDSRMNVNNDWSSEFSDDFQLRQSNRSNDRSRSFRPGKSDQSDGRRSGWSGKSSSRSSGFGSSWSSEYSGRSSGFRSGWSNESSGRSSGFSSGRNDWSNESSTRSGTDSHTSQFNDSKPERVGIDWAAIHAGRAEAQAKKWSGLPDIVKHFYTEDPEIAALTSDEVETFRSHHNGISVVDISDKDRWPPNPVKTFEQAFASYPEILEEIYKQNFEVPSPIQCQSWPVLLKGYDMVGIAQTGTGKTLAFLLPALVHIDGQVIPRTERSGPTVLVLTPTRELALQIEREVRKFSYKGIKSVCIYGGGNRREQIQTVAKGVEIVIATPGRLNDLLMNGILCLRSVTYLILDEADRMLDMGFEPQIKKVLLDIRPDRQTVMTSATWPPGVRRLAESYMKEPFQVTVGTLDLRACVLVEQLVEFIEDADKKGRTMQFINDMKDGEKVLIFCSKKATADDLASDLLLHGLPVQSIHGDREQEDREQALEDFKTGLAPILVATDVASRGLDIKDITFVVNYDFPMHIEDYVHRVGRTGRAGSRGKALTFMSRNNWKWARQLIKILADADQVVPDDLVSMADRYDQWRERNAGLRRY